MLPKAENIFFFPRFGAFRTRDAQAKTILLKVIRLKPSEEKDLDYVSEPTSELWP